MRDLPTGTLTLLFTDVEGSTRLLRTHGPAYADLLDEHRRILREAFRNHGGVEVDTQGDAFFAVFRAAADAAAAALEARRALSDTSVRVRMGIHTGEPRVTAEGYVGMDVHRGARVAACGHGGQIVVSASTRALLGDDVELHDLGEHRLKDLGRAERLFQLGDGTFPPLRTLDATNLPLAAGPLLGRERELSDVLAFLGNGSREVTVTGPGGTGKTRFALQVAAELVGTFSDGVFWVPLASVADPELVEPEIAQALGARDSLSDFLQGKSVLLLLDNFEHLLDAAPAVSRLLAGAGGLRVLVTSRSPLRIAGEREYPLDPLPPSDSVNLFVERAQAIGREIAADETVAAICRRLDGLPLAIELAAARTRLLTPEKLLERLDRALELLTGGARDAPDRHRTLRATIGWSYDLLDEDCRRLFSRLSVFAGSFSLEAAEDVCDAELETLATLVDASLLKATGDDRFLLLETIRELAAERLADADESAFYVRRHASFFAALAEEAYAGRLERESEWAARLARDHDDLRASLDRLTADGDDRQRCDSRAHSAGSGSRTRTSTRDGDGSRLRSKVERPTTARAPVRSCRPGNSRRGSATSSSDKLDWPKRSARGRPSATTSSAGTLWTRSAGCSSTTWARTKAHSPHSRRVSPSAAASADGRGETHALVGVCQVLVALGEVDRAEALSVELLELARTHDDPRAEHFAHHFLADCALIAGDCDEAEVRYRRSLEAALPLGDVLETSFEVQGVAMASAGLGRTERALVLAGSVEALWESLGTSISIRFWDELLDRYLGAARSELGTEAGPLWAEGRALSFDEAVALALGAEEPARTEPGV